MREEIALDSLWHHYCESRIELAFRRRCGLNSPISPVLNRDNTISRLENKARNIQHIVAHPFNDHNNRASCLPVEDRPRHSNALPAFPQIQNPTSVYPEHRGSWALWDHFHSSFPLWLKKRQRRLNSGIIS
jgi:hypothetical protein